MKVFIDTWGWISLIDSRESQHTSVKGLIDGLRPRADVIYTSDYVLDEAITFQFGRIPLPNAIVAMQLFDESEKRGYLNVEYITPERFSEARALRLKYSDKPLISFTDLTSAVVMRELGVTQIISAGAHLTHLGLGFTLLP